VPVIVQFAAVAESAFFTVMPKSEGEPVAFVLSVHELAFSLTETFIAIAAALVVLPLPGVGATNVTEGSVPSEMNS
jgi:hypothetical protein